MAPGWLDQIDVAAPCGERWDDMRGDERVRVCERCDQRVYDLSALSRAEAERLVAGAGGAVCVRFRRRADGTVVTRDCPPPRRSIFEELRILGLGVLVGAQLAGSVALADATPPPKRPRPGALVEHTPSVPPDPPPVTMGALSPTVVRPPIEKLRRCYQSALAHRPNLAGRVTLRFTIADGRVEDATLDSTLGEPELEHCILEAVRTFRFPSAEGRVQVAYPIVFQPAP
jgi:TonB family protein